MKTRFGKITLTAICLIVLIALLYLAQGAIENSQAAAAIDTKTFILPVDAADGERSTATAITIVVLDAMTCNVVSGTDGTSSASTTWDAGEIAGAQHTISNEWKFTIPKPAATVVPYIKVYHAAAASVSKTTVPSEKPTLYDWSLNMPYGSTNPIGGGAVIVRPQY